MALYRIYRLDPAGHITDAYPVDCRSDNVALNIAPRVWQWAASVEVWEAAGALPAWRPTGCALTEPARAGRRYAA